MQQVVGRSGDFCPTGCCSRGNIGVFLSPNSSHSSRVYACLRKASNTCLMRLPLPPPTSLYALPTTKRWIFRPQQSSSSPSSSSSWFRTDESIALTISALSDKNSRLPRRQTEIGGRDVAVCRSNIDEDALSWSNYRKQTADKVGMSISEKEDGNRSSYTASYLDLFFSWAFISPATVGCVLLLYGRSSVYLS